MRSRRRRRGARRRRHEALVAEGRPEHPPPDRVGSRMTSGAAGGVASSRSSAMPLTRRRQTAHRRDVGERPVPVERAPERQPQAGLGQRKVELDARRARTGLAEAVASVISSIRVIPRSAPWNAPGVDTAPISRRRRRPGCRSCRNDARRASGPPRAREIGALRAVTFSIRRDRTVNSSTRVPSGAHGAADAHHAGPDVGHAVCCERRADVEKTKGREE